MSRYTETQKTFLKDAFSELLESEKDFLVWETAEIDNMNIKRKVFRISIEEYD